MFTRFLRSSVRVPFSRSFTLIPYHGSSGQPASGLLGRPADLKLAQSLPHITLTPRQLCDLELILNGGFSPLNGFMSKKDYQQVVHNRELADGTLFPLPICLDVSGPVAHRILNSNDRRVTLKDPEGNVLALLEVEDVYQPNKREEAELVFGGDPEHPAVDYLMRKAGEYYIGGKVQGYRLPVHHDYQSIRHTPKEMREMFTQQNWVKQPIVAFQTRNPLHRAHFELTRQACDSVAGNLLLHPVIGMTKPGDVDHHTRIKCYKAIMPHYPQGKALLSGLPLAMRMAGPREAILHAIIRQNYGATHFIIGRDHAGPGSNSKGKEFYTAYQARDEALQVQNRLKIQLLPYDMLLYVPERKVYLPAAQVTKGEKTQALSGTEVRRRLQTGEAIPEWFSFPSVVQILRDSSPPRTKQGFCVFLTGLSGSGKSTLANALVERLMELQNRKISLLDGDIVRQLLSSELGFSEEHRNLNIKRIGYVASLIVKSGGIAIAAPIAPYAASRQFARDVVEEAQSGSFLEVFVSAPLEACEKRDPKGLYAKARAGQLKHFTGIDDPYEPPQKPDLALSTTEEDVQKNVEANVDRVIQELKKRGFIE